MRIAEEMQMVLCRFHLMHQAERLEWRTLPWWLWSLWALWRVVFWLHWFAHSPYRCPRCGLPMWSPRGYSLLRCMVCCYEVTMQELVETEEPADIWEAVQRGPDIIDPLAP